jgi:hypothetical protein
MSQRENWHKYSSWTSPPPFCRIAREEKKLFCVEYYIAYPGLSSEPFFLPFIRVNVTLKYQRIPIKSSDAGYNTALPISFR